MNYSRQDALAITAQKKKECNTKALRIVETMLDTSVRPEWLLENAKYISLSHFQDVIEERAISKQCGYPLCDRCLGKIPRQQFHISTKTNKVYDITERKNFCSGMCYKASQFLKKQLLTSPLWLRDNETMPDFQLLPLNLPGGQLGKEVEFEYDIKAHTESDDHLGEVKKSPSSSENENSPSYSEEMKDDSKTEEVVHDAASININAAHDAGTSSNEHDNEVLMDPFCKNPKKIVSHAQGSNHESKHKEAPVRRLKSKKAGKSSEQSHNSVSYVMRIEKCFSEWFTLDSLIYIHGIDKAKEVLKDKVACLKYTSKHQSTCMNPENERRYTDLCKKLSLLEMEDDLESGGHPICGSKPLPNFEQLKEDARLMEIKVRKFYEGIANINLSDATKSDDTSENSSIPLVDLHAQHALRRRIILDRLRHVLPDLLRTLGMSSRDISDDVRGLFMTFSLKADNIMFKPAEWNLISLIILRMISFRDVKIKSLMETKLAQRYCSMMLMAFQLDYGYMDQLIASLCEADDLILKTH